MKRTILPVACLLSALWPEWLWYGERMTDGSDEPYGLVALVAGFWLLWRDRRDLRIETRSLLLAVALLGIHVLARPWLPSMISALFAIGILAVATGSFRSKPGVWATFALSLPLIASLQFYIGYPLRMAAALSAEAILTLTPLQVTRVGTELYWHSARVGVDPPCSGVEMLWAGLFIVSLLCALRRYSFQRTLLALSVGTLAIVASNCLRVTLLFLKEAEAVPLPAWTHEGIGIALFGILIWFLDRWLLPDKKASPTTTSPLSQLEPRYRLPNAFACLAMAFGPFLLHSAPDTKVDDSPFPGWPEKWENRYLEPLPLTQSEASFANRFPGKLGVFSNGPDKIVIRWITRPTRKLHSASDCLKAVGFEIDQERDGTFIAIGDRGTYIVEETIYNDTDNWNNVTKWFWAATLRKTEGPWWAVTRITSI